MRKELCDKKGQDTEDEKTRGKMKVYWGGERDKIQREGGGRVIYI